MLHYLSKLTTLLWQPLTWVAALLVIGVLFLFVHSPKLRRWGRTLCASAAGLLLLLGWQPLPESLVQNLEDRYTPPSGDLSSFTGMVVLGGAFRGNDGRNRGQPALGCAGERVVVPVPIMNQYPHMRLLFTGGNAWLFSKADAEATTAKSYFERMGTDMSRVLLESRSRNTYENAAFSVALPGVDKAQPWLLVTSASHMPRALATFQKLGWNVTPFPVDYYSKRETQWLQYSLFGGIDAWQLALREYLGWVVYRVTGRL